MLNPRTHSRDYPDSYYNATKQVPLNSKVLQETVKVDVAIIGGGFSGINTAIELAERGISVALLEAYYVGWGASGRNGGQLIRALSHDLDRFENRVGKDGVRLLEDMGFEAVDIVRARVGKYGIDCDLKMGYCDLANRAKDLDGLIEEKAALDARHYGFEVRLVAKEDLPAQVVGSESYCGGLVDMGSGHLHPLNLVIGEAKAAQALGVKIFEQSPVLDVIYGNPHRIKTAEGEIQAERVVHCTNAYGQGLNNTLEGKILPAGSYVLATEPLPEELAKRVLPSDMAVCDQRIALDYYRLSADNRLLFGGLCTYSGRDPKSIVAALQPHMLNVFPYLKEVKVDYAWGGLIGIGANRMPQIGRLSPSVYYAQAYSGHGLNSTHMAGRLIAEAIDGQDDRLKVLEAINHMTFPGGRLLRSPLLATGMLWHRLKDLF